MSDQTLQSFAQGLAHHGEKLAILAMRKRDADRWTYHGLARHVEQLAKGMQAKGLKTGSRVALLSDNSPAWITACLACLRCGIIPVPLDAQFTGDVLSHVIGDSEPAMIFTVRDKAEALRNLGIENLPEMVLLDAEADDAQSWQQLMKDGEPETMAVEADDQALLFYTSGTTGPPKGVDLSHRNLMFQLDAMRKAELIGEDDRVLLPLPLHHVYPFVFGMLGPMSLGLPIVFPKSLTGPQIVRALREGEVTAVVGVPRLYRALVSGIEAKVSSAGRSAEVAFAATKHLSTTLRRTLGVQPGKLLRPLHKQFGENLRLLASGGSPLDADLAMTLEGLGWRVTTGYGLTETSPLLTWNLPGDAKFGTAGKPVPGVEIDIDTEAAPEGAGEGQGEVVARGPGIFMSYRHLPDKTREVLSEGGWFRTGDLGYFDNKGYLIILGRVSTMIVTEAGENVQPDALEESYSEHPTIREIGVLQKDGKLVALIVPEMRQVRDGDLEEAVRQAVHERGKELASYQRLADFAVTREPIPRTRLGKVRRHMLEERYEQAKAGEEPGEARAEPMSPEEMSSEDRNLLSDSAARQVWDWLVERYPDEPLTPDTNLQLDLGIDSMDWLDLTLEIGQRAGVELDEEAIDQTETVRDLLQAVADASEGDHAAPLEEPEAVIDERQKRWLKPQGPVQELSAQALFGLNRHLIRQLFIIEARGTEHLPDQPPFVIASNHLSVLDPFVIAACLSESQRKQTYWSGWPGMTMTNPITRWGSRLARVVPVDSQRSVISGLAFSALVLKRKQILVWFPEGKRSETGELQPFKPGLGRLMTRYPAPIVPVFIHGTHEAMPPGQHLPHLRKQVWIIFGKPLASNELEQQGEGEQPYDRIVSALHDRIAELGEQVNE